MDNEILNYKDLAALPKIKAIYEVQRPDLISYEPYHRYTSDETLERYSYGEVLSLGMPTAGLHRCSGKSCLWVCSLHWESCREAEAGLGPLLESPYHWEEGLGWKGDYAAADDDDVDLESKQ